jgi:hypothetical protein
MSLPTDQIVSLVGAAMILAAFAATSFERLDLKSRSYLALNFVGASLLLYTAWVGDQWGFVVLEVSWALVAGIGLVRAAVRPAPSG